MLKDKCREIHHYFELIGFSQGNQYCQYYSNNNSLHLCSASQGVQSALQWKKTSLNTINIVHKSV